MSYSLRQQPAYYGGPGRGNYDIGRGGFKVDKIIIHHAATTSFDGIARTFQTIGRMASAHYGVGQNQNVDQYVDEANMAWAAGNLHANRTGINIENVNSSGAPDWNVAQSTFDTLVELTRDIAVRNNLLPLVVGVNLFDHNMVSDLPTYCAGKLRARLQELADRVNGSEGGGAGPAPSKPSNGEIADRVIAGHYGNDPERSDKLRAEGYDPVTIQNIVNNKLNYGGGQSPAPSTGTIVKGDQVIVTNPVDEKGTSLATSGAYTVMELNGSRAVIGRGGVVTAALNVGNLRKA